MVWEKKGFAEFEKHAKCCNMQLTSSQRAFLIRILIMFSKKEHVC